MNESRKNSNGRTVTYPGMAAPGTNFFLPHAAGFTKELQPVTTDHAPPSLPYVMTPADPVALNPSYCGEPPAGFGGVFPTMCAMAEQHNQQQLLAAYLSASAHHHRQALGNLLQYRGHEPLKPWDLSGLQHSTEAAAFQHDSPPMVPRPASDSDQKTVSPLDYYLMAQNYLLQ